MSLRPLYGNESRDYIYLACSGSREQCYQGRAWSHRQDHTRVIVLIWKDYDYDAQEKGLSGNSMLFPGHPEIVEIKRKRKISLPI